MKTITIGNQEYLQCETAEDIGIKRFTHLKEYLIYKDTGVDVPSLIKAISGFVDGFDKESKSQMLISLKDYLTGLTMAKSGKDPDQMIFALITLDKDENPHEFSEGMLIEKLERMNKQGLTQGRVETDVENFTVACQSHFVTSFLKNLELRKEVESI